MQTFISKCLSSLENPNNIDNYIDIWHESDSDLPLHEYLGMYQYWVNGAKTLSEILNILNNN